MWRPVVQPDPGAGGVSSPGQAERWRNAAQGSPSACPSGDLEFVSIHGLLLQFNRSTFQGLWTWVVF